MRHIHKFYHEISSAKFEQLFEKRSTFDSAVHLGLSIKPIAQPNTYELYYVPSAQMLSMMSELYKVSRDFNDTFEELPNIARRQFINECIVEELYNTNELEGIRSSREEIARSTRDIIEKKKTNKRFESMIRSYHQLIKNEYEVPVSAKDIRKIYDDITKGEIEQQELPDGEIFRQEVTYIVKKSVSGKVVHHGIIPESEIIRLIEKLLKFMNNNFEIPNLIKVAVGHYYFGYIHPFYDGNGRTSRFISSIYLSQDLGDIPALSLSRGCNKYRTKYMEAFEITNSIKSRGEMNSFIETFLDITIRALKQMHEELKEKNELLKLAFERIKLDSRLSSLTGMYTDIMFVLAQNYFFDSNSGLTAGNLAAIFDKSEATIRKMIKELTALSMVEQKGERPAYFCVTHNYFEDRTGYPSSKL